MTGVPHFTALDPSEWTPTSLSCAHHPETRLRGAMVHLMDDLVSHPLSDALWMIYCDVCREVILFGFPPDPESHWTRHASFPVLDDSS